MSVSSSSRNILSGLVRNYASAAKATATKEVAAAGAATKTVSTVEKKDWKAVQLPAKTVEGLASTNMPGASFLNDLRSTSGLGLGDGIKTHTGKWLQVCDVGSGASVASCSSLFQVSSKGSFIQDVSIHAGSGTITIRVFLFHTQQGSTKSPMEYIQEVKPIKVSGTVVASHGCEFQAHNAKLESNARLSPSSSWHLQHFNPI